MIRYVRSLWPNRGVAVVRTRDGPTSPRTDVVGSAVRPPARLDPGGKVLVDVPGAVGPVGGDLVDPSEVVARQHDVRGADVLLEASSAPRSRDRDDVIALSEQPGECELRPSDALLVGQVAEPLDRLLVPGVVLALPARVAPAHVGRVVVARRPDVRGEEAAAERRVRDEAD